MKNIMVFGLYFMFIIGAGVLQGFLSNAKNRYLGFVFPFISFGISLVVVISVILFMAAGVAKRDAVLYILYLFFMMNLPTLILLGIYFLVRKGRKEKREKNTELDKMNIRDL